MGRGTEPPGHCIAHLMGGIIWTLKFETRPTHRKNTRNDNLLKEKGVAPISGNREGGEGVGQPAIERNRVPWRAHYIRNMIGFPYPPSNPKERPLPTFLLARAFHKVLRPVPVSLHIWTF